MDIAHRLRTLREQANIGQAEVAAALDVSIPTVSQWESGKKAPGRRRIPQLAHLFRVSSDFILSGVQLQQSDEGASDEESNLLKLFRRSSPHLRVAVMTILREAATGEEREPQSLETHVRR